MRHLIGRCLVAVFGLCLGGAAIAQSYPYRSQFGWQGTDFYPNGIAVDPVSYNIVVVDSVNNRVQIFDPFGTYLGQFGSLGIGDGQFHRPIGIAIDPARRNIVVTDADNERVQIFDSAGVYVSQFRLYQDSWSPPVPGFVAIDPVSRNIVVADTNTHRIHIFDSAGVYISHFGSQDPGGPQGRGNGQFSSVAGVAIDPVSRNIAVADYDRVQIFDATGVYLSQFGSRGSSDGQFNYAGGVAIDPVSRNIFVVDRFNHRVQIFDANGVYQDQFGQLGRFDGEFDTPAAIAVTSHSALVTDWSNHRVQIFGPATTTFTVTNTNDSGLGSLRDAIAQANFNTGSKTIDIIATGTIVLTSGQLRISSGPLTINGPGAGNLTIDGDTSGRIFAIVEASAPSCPALTGPADYLVSLSGMSLQNGQVDPTRSGGAIFSAKSLVLDSMVIRDNVAKYGGGVSWLTQYQGQSLTVNGVQFLDNIARSLGATSGEVHGGALLMGANCFGTETAATATISASLFSGNEVRPGPLSGYGGAIAAFGYFGSIAISDSRIVDNYVRVPLAPVAGTEYVGGGLAISAFPLTIERTEIAQNSAPSGGAMLAFNDTSSRQDPGSAMRLRLVNSTVSGNRNAESKGAIVLYGNVAAELDHTTVSDNLVANLTAASGILMITGPTEPVSRSDATRPSLTVVSSIVANSSGADIATDSTAFGSTISTTNSLIESICSTCYLVVTGSGNLFGMDPLLGPLDFHGAATRTHPLMAGSPAIDTGINPLNLSTDQRGVTRPQGLASDIGAFELVDPTPPLLACGIADGLWHNGDVAIACAANDPESGLENPGDAAFSLVTTTTIGTETANATTGSRQVCNTLGGCVTAAPIAGNKVDRKPPMVVISSPVEGAAYQKNWSAVASYACTDGGSGMASCQGPVPTGSRIDTSSAGTKTFTVNATDGVGNASSAVVTYSVYSGLGPSANVGISLSAPNKVDTGLTLTYSMTVKNAGKATATDVVVVDAIPAGTVFESVSTSQGTVAAPAVGSNGTMTVSLGNLVNGATAIVSLTVTVTAAAGTDLINAVSVTATSPDFHLGNNSASAKTTVK